MGIHEWTQVWDIVSVYGANSKYWCADNKRRTRRGEGRQKERILNTFEQNREAAAAVSLLVCAHGTIGALPPPSILETH